jgi:hypothetical protein
MARADLVLAEGSSTGHRHEVRPATAAKLFELEGTLYLHVNERGAEVVHPEHGPIPLLAGSYRVWRQREYDGSNLPRFVMD